MRRYDLPGVLHELRRRSSRRRPQGTPPLVADAEPMVSVVCVSNRPGQLSHILDMFSAQDWTHKELVLLVNAAEYPTAVAEEIADVRVLRTDPSVTLGSCLNQGFASTSAEVIARFDDDDCYSPGYLQSVVEVFRTVDARVTGKSEYFAYVESQDRIIRRFPGRAERYVGRVAGGSLAVIAEAVREVAFPDENLGEDVEYLRRCERAGLRIWAPAAQGFLQIRSTGDAHTWGIDDDRFVTHAEDVGKGRSAILWN